MSRVYYEKDFPVGTKVLLTNGNTFLKVSPSNEWGWVASSYEKNPQFKNYDGSFFYFPEKIDYIKEVIPPKKPKENKHDWSEVLI